MPQTGDSIWGQIRSLYDKGGNVRVRDVTITSAQLLALNATLITIIPAPGTNRFNLFRGAIAHKASGVAYAGVAAGEDIAFKYTNASGLAVAEIEVTGFLDQATAQTRYVHPYIATGVTADSSITPVVNAAIVAEMLTGEIITGDSDLLLRVFYSVMPNLLTF